MMTAAEIKTLAVAVAQSVSAMQGVMLTAGGVRAYLGGMSRSTFHRICGELDFPKPVQVGDGRRWRRREIDVWVERRKVAKQPARA